MANWSDEEDEIIIADYFQMLNAEIAGRIYNKTAHRNGLIALLNNRSESAIEYKHQNISAALINMGLPYISGYKPRWNYQKKLEAKISDYIHLKPSLENNFTEFANQNIQIESDKIQFSNWNVDPPKPTTLKEPIINYYKPVKRNYLELEQNNRSIGEKGEQLVFEYEKWRLKSAGFPALAKEVNWISKTQGDGLGYDILSKNVLGKDIYIEVKTTTLGKETPIFFSKRENEFSNENKKSFHLYRVFNVKKQPEMFILNGAFKDICSMEANSFKGFF